MLRALFDRPVRRLGNFYVRRICAREYDRMAYVSVNERPIEFAFLFRQLVISWPKTILDVGTGKTALPHLLRNCGFHVTATDNIKDYWPQGMVNRHYHVINDDITQSALTGTYDVISCISVLEHIGKHREAVKAMGRLLAPGGRLILSCPYNDKKYSENVYALPESSVTESYPFVTQAFSRVEVDVWLQETGLELIEQEYWQLFDGEYWTCGERIIPPRSVSVDEQHQITCLVLGKPQ